ncbi:LOW QUALITY PROTEIN: mitochondrial enolase superfamily member 1 [Amazona ochrocephala]
MPNSLYSAWISDIFTDVLTDEEAYEEIYILLQYASRFKVKVGANLDDICRCRFIQEMIVLDKIMMLDANQQWEIKEAIEWVTKPADFKPQWIKEPSFPEGHATISKVLALLGIGVQSEHLLYTKALSSLQMDSCKLGCVNENLPVLLMVQSKAPQNTAAMRKSFSTLQASLISFFSCHACDF